MLQSTRRWLRRNRTGIAIGAAVVGGTYLVGQYVVGKIRDARDRIQLDKIAKENIRRRFEQNQIDCTITVLALLPTLSENVLEALPAERLTQELQQKKQERLARVAEGVAPSEASSHQGDVASLSGFSIPPQPLGDGSQRLRRTKAQLWNDLKITSITRAFTLIYSLSLLVLLTRIQLNLLGRLNYLSSVISLSQPPPPERANSISLENHEDPSAHFFGNDFETNRRYLTFSWYVLHRGYVQILSKVRTAVEQVFNNISPNEGISQQRLSELVMEVRKRVEGADEAERYSTRWLPYILPPKEEEESVLIESGVITPPGTSAGPDSTSPPQPDHISTQSGRLRSLLDESADLIDSPAFTRIHTLILDTLFSHLINNKTITTLYPQTTRPTSPPASEADTSSIAGPRIQELSSAVTVVPADPQVKLASILAVFTRQAHVIGDGTNPPNEYLGQVEQEVKELESFAAVIYTRDLDKGVEERRSRVEMEESNTTNEVHEESLQGDSLAESQLEGAWERVTRSTISLR